MKNFNKFLEEVSIEGNPAIPGEGGRREGERKWTEDAERIAKQRMEIRPQDVSRRGPRGPIPSEKEMRIGMRLMQLLQQSLQWSDGHEEELSNLATDVFTNLYSSLIERYEIEVDIKLIKPGRVKQWMDDQEEEDDNPDFPEFREVVEEDIRNEVHKRKIANLIIQGEAKNTKHILHSEDVKAGLREIYGNDADTVFNILDEMTKIADQLDWIIPIETKQEMMEMMPDGMAGASSVGWKPKEEKEEEEDKEEEEYFGGEDEEEMYDESEEEPMERFDSTPIVKARGVDFAMLLHESVKGLFELLSVPGIPEDERTAKIALSNTGASDEPEDFRYGPEIAAELRDFINENKDIDKYPNIREEVYRMMVDKETMPTREFLDLMRGILNKSEKARRDIDRLVAKVIKDKEEMEQYQKDMVEYNKQMKEWEDYQKAPKQPTSSQPSRQSVTPKKKGLSEMEEGELRDAMEEAIGDEDYALAAQIRDEMARRKMKESILYGRELKMILERKTRLKK
jgi:hypothetical protein